MLHQPHLNPASRLAGSAASRPAASTAGRCTPARPIGRALSEQAATADPLARTLARAVQDRASAAIAGPAAATAPPIAAGASMGAVLQRTEAGSTEARLDAIEHEVTENRKNISYVDMKVRSVASYAKMPFYESAWIKAKSREESVQQLNLAGSLAAPLGTRGALQTVGGLADMTDPSKLEKARARLDELGGTAGAYWVLPNLPPMSPGNRSKLENRIFVEGGTWGAPRGDKQLSEMQGLLAEAVRRRQDAAEGMPY